MAYKQSTEKSKGELAKLKKQVQLLEERVKTIEELLDYKNRYTKA